MRLFYIDGLILGKGKSVFHIVNLQKTELSKEMYHILRNPEDTILDAVNDNNIKFTYRGKILNLTNLLKIVGKK